MKILKIIALILITSGIISFIYFTITNSPPNNFYWNKNNTDTSPTLKDAENIVKNFIDTYKNNTIDILILGIPGEGYNAGKLTDSIIVSHYDFKKNKLCIISIPRDLWISDGKKSYKINEMLRKNRLKFAMGLIAKITGLKLDGYAIIDLNTIKNVVNWLGGIDITTDESAVDWVSGFILPAGKHHLDGDTAIWLIRNRYNKQGDFFREKNQQKIIDALIKKIMNLPIDKKYELVKTFLFTQNILKNIDIDFSKIIPLILNKKITEVSTKHIILSPDTGLTKISSIKIDLGNNNSTRVSIVMPTAGFNNYSEIKKYIQKAILN